MTSLATTRSLRIAVLSDLHAYSPDATTKEAPSRFVDTLVHEQSHPMGALLGLIDAHALQADLVLCGGDIADRASPKGIDLAWRCIHEIGAALNAELTTATVGNHDVDSRHQANKYDPKGFLMRLSPQYPLQDGSLCDRFWARNYVIVEKDHYRLVILNSCAFHGYGAEDLINGRPHREIDHGRISEYTIDALRAELDALPHKEVNILLCHHHPQQHVDIDYEDYEKMSGGDGLLGALEAARCGPWLVVHGHKHHPKIAYGGSGSTGPVIFSAGSFSAYLYKALQSRAQNQFYMIEVPLDLLSTMGLVGQVKAWDWTEGVGWIPATGIASGLPVLSGFGYRVNPTVIAQQICNAVNTDGLSDWNDLVVEIPELRFCVHTDLLNVSRTLETRHNLSILGADIGIPTQVGQLLGR